MRRLIYLARTFPPVSTGSAPMNLRITALLVRNGWTPIVITPHPSGDLPLDPSLEELVDPGVRIVRSGRKRNRSRTGPSALTAESRGRSSLRQLLRSFVLTILLQPDRYITWLPLAVTASVREILRSDAELIVTLGPPHSVHIAGLISSLITGRKWVALFGDLWARDGLINWNELPPSRRFWSKTMESMVVRNADGLVTTTCGSSNYFRVAYGTSCPPVATLWNGLTRGELDRLWKDSPQIPLENGLIITYTGFFMGNQSPEYFLRGMRMFLDRHPDRRVVLRIVGDLGKYSDLPEELQLGENVEITGIVPFLEVSEWQSNTHLLLLLLPPQPGNELKNPAKTVEYLVARRPILSVAPDGDMKNLLERLGVSYNADHSPESVCSALEKAYEDIENGKQRVLNNPEDLTGEMDMEAGVRALANFLERIAYS